MDHPGQLVVKLSHRSALSPPSKSINHPFPAPVYLSVFLNNSFPGDLRKPWTDEGHVIKIPNSFGEEVGLELKGMSDVPTECTRNFTVDFVWKPTSFDRMLASLKVFICTC